MTNAAPSQAGSSWVRGVPAAIVALVAGLLVTSAIGFFPGYLREFPVFASSGWQVHFHVATLLAWLGLLVAQAWLAASGRIEQHRIAGRLSYLLVPLIIVGFVLVSRFGQQRQPNPALIGAALFDGALFVLFYVLAIANRRHPEIHSRYMLLTAVALINAPLGRAVAPELSVPFELLVMLTMLVVSRLRARPWKPFLVGVIAYVALLGAIFAALPPE